MYYKILNKESEVYKTLFQMRKKELQIGKDNIKAIEEKTSLEWDSFVGYSGQQNFNRTTQYVGFKFNDEGKVDLKIWKKSKDYEGCYEPNRRTKLGREMAEFLLNGLQGNMYSNVFKALGIEDSFRKFTYPYVEIEGESLVLYLGEECKITDDDIIEITSKEFKEILNT